MSGDTPYYNLAIPLPQSSYAQEKIGMLQIDPDENGTALVAHGDIQVDGCIMNLSNDSCIWVNSSNTVNVSALSTSLSGTVTLNNINMTTPSVSGINYSAAVPSSSVSWYQQGGLYLTSCSTVLGVSVNVLAVMP